MKIALTFAALMIAVPAGAVTTVEVTPGTGQRSLTLANFAPLGQSFLSTGTELLSFGFQVQTLNAPLANGPITLSIINGDGLSGALVAARSVTFSGIPATRTPTWVDFDFTGTALLNGARYSAIITSASNRFGLIYGPNINLNNGALLGPDAYADGRFLATGFNDRPCSTGACDANFRFTTDTALAPVPEPSTWALMILGMGVVGGAMRRRMRARVRFA
jgi:hypothetical protein